MKKLIQTTHSLLFMMILLSPPGTSLAADEWPADAGVEIGQIGAADGLPEGFEPSGAVWHPVRQTLLVVGDSGLVAELDPAQGVLAVWSMDEDLEGITIADPDDGLVYLAIENPDGILEFDLATGTATGNHWDLTPWLDGPDNHGLEAVTAVAGLFYAGLQENGNIFIFNLLADGVVQHQGTIASHEGRDDISGLHYDPCTEILFAVYDSHDIIVEMAPGGVFLREYELTGDSQEGVALIGESTAGQTTIFIAEDAGEVWMYGQYSIGPCDFPASSVELPTSQPVGLVCRPNPFNPRTVVFFELNSRQSVQLSIYDLRGQLVRDLVTRTLAAGEHQVIWDGCSQAGLPLASGIYFASIETKTHRETVKLVLAR